ncbi:MAG: SDR family oxidoreductase, partial [Verrucomicrobia bacterium]|nr:SDR family oxidoreductase [Verrucomicrobiota bacterium]
GEFGIRANAVCPGVIQTTAHQKEFDDPTFVKNYLRLIPLNRFGKPENIASAIYFLASDESAFMTGQYMVVDGGQMCGQNYSRIFDETKWVPASSAANKT